MMVEYDRNAPTIDAWLFSENGHWITGAMRQANSIELRSGSEVAPLALPTGDLYQTALALEKCG